MTAMISNHSQNRYSWSSSVEIDEFSTHSKIAQRFRSLQHAKLQCVTLIMYGFITPHHGYILLLHNSVHPNGLLAMKIFHIVGEEINKNGCSWPSTNCIASSPARLLLAVLAHFYFSSLLVYDAHLNLCTNSTLHYFILAWCEFSFPVPHFYFAIEILKFVFLIDFQNHSRRC